MNTIETAALLLMAFGFLPLLICIIKIFRLKKYKASATLTTALVTESQKRTGFKSADYYVLTIQYTSYKGIPFSAQTIVRKEYSAGDSIVILYTTEHPEKFTTDLGHSLRWWLPISILLVILVGCFCYGLLNI